MIYETLNKFKIATLEKVKCNTFYKNFAIAVLDIHKSLPN